MNDTLINISTRMKNDFYIGVVGSVVAVAPKCI